jgi:hypothetical protein
VRPTPYVATLRIYEPLTSFPAVDQLRFENLNPTTDTRFQEQERALRRIITPEPLTARVDGVHILELDNQRFISPWTTAVRTWGALNEVKSNFPEEIVSLFITPTLEEVLLTGAEEIGERAPYALDSTWIIPPRWFTLFEPQDRIRGYIFDEPFSIARAPIAQAKSRVRRAHEIVLSAFGDGFVAGEIEELADWLDLFHPHSMVELDYGGLAGYMDSTLKAAGECGIEADGSIEDILFSLTGLANHDGETAGAGYERLVLRWREIQALQSAM